MKRIVPALILMALTIPGAFGLWWRVRDGLMATELTNHVVWGLWVSMSILFLGLSASGFVLSSLAYSFGFNQLERVGKLAVLQAFVCLLMGVVLIWIDLGHPQRLFMVLTSPNHTSLLSWAAYVYLVYFAALAAELWILRSVTAVDELAESRKRLLKGIALVGIPVVVVLYWSTGALFAVVKDRPEWNTGTTPLALLATAALSGTALLMVLATLFDRKDEGHNRTMGTMAKLAGGLLVLHLLLLASEGLVVWYARAAHQVSSLHHLWFGPYGVVGWVLHLLLGALVPLAIFGVARFRNYPTLVALAAVLVVLSTVGYGLNTVIPAQIDSPFRELSTAVYHVRNSAEYFPNAVELLSTLAVIVGGCWLFWLGHALLNRRQHTATHGS